MTTNETEVSTRGFAGEFKRSGVQSRLHIRVNRKFCNHHECPGLRLGGSSGLGVCSELPWGPFNTRMKKIDGTEQDISPKGTPRTASAVEACESITRGIEGQLRIKSRKGVPESPLA